MSHELPNHFRKFLREIRPTDSQRKDCQTGHRTLRDRLNNDEELKPIIVSTVLQGSYRRATAVRPKNDTRSDVDVIVVTRINRDDHTPDQAMDRFEPFLEEYYAGKYRRQGRSFGIELSYVDLDLVITSAPSEAQEAVYFSKAAATVEDIEEATDWRLVPSWIPISERVDEQATASLIKEARVQAEWKTEPLWIPDRAAGKWTRTDPLRQIQWTQGKNARCNRHYVNIVKALKWWQRVQHESSRPKSYPLEHLIGQCLPDNVQSVAEGVVACLEAIRDNYTAHVVAKTKPVMSDHGVPEHDVFGRLNAEEFATFHSEATDAAKLAREAFDADSARVAATKWRELFGDRFPPPSDDDEDDDDASGGPKGPFIINSARGHTGDTTPRRYG